VPHYLFNLGSEADGPAINASSGGFGPAASEFQACQIASLRGSLVWSPRIASVGAALECKACEVVHLPPTPGGRITWRLAECWASISPTRTSRMASSTNPRSAR
jgi:hypothetical protein